MHSWNTYIDGYCERLEPGFWSEPLNAVTNLAFIIAAFVAARWLGGGRHAQTRVLVAILAAIGVGSFLFHTFATRWAAMSDVVPIAMFVLYFLYLSNRYFLGLNVVPAFLATLLFFPYAPAATYGVAWVFPFIGGSAAYVSIALLIFIYAVLLARKMPDVSRGLLLGGCLLMVSIGFRIADGRICDSFPQGTHMFWHIINAVMLAWMIQVIRKTLDGNMAGRAGEHSSTS